MRRFRFVIGFVALAALAAFFGWGFYAMRDFGSWTGGSRAIAIMIGVGAIATGALTGALMWLAFYSSRKGYDEVVKFDRPEDRR
jgi:hypothetical protein